MSEKQYSFVSEEVFLNKISYSYSTYLGTEFIELWRNFRNGFVKEQDSTVNPDISTFVKKRFSHSGFENATEEMFNNWIDSLLRGQNPENEIYLLLRRFEVTKKIYGSYDINFRPIDKSDFQQYYLYLKFGQVLVLLYKNTRRIQILNTLLKLNDINCSLYNKMNDDQRTIMAWLISMEMQFIDKLISQKLINIGDNN